MNFFSFIDDDNISEVRIKKKKIIFDSSSANVRNIDIQLSIEVVYCSDSEQTEKIKTVKEYIEYWFYNFNAVNLKPSSLDRKEQTIKQQVLPYLGDKNLYQLTKDDIQFMVNDLSKKGISFSTIKKAYEAINGCLKFAVENEEISKNPALYVTLPEKTSKSKKEVRWFNEHEVQLIKKEALRCYKNERPVHRLGYIFPFLINTGMRIGETLALRWNNVDFEKETIFIQNTIAQIKNRDKTEDSKNYKLIIQSVKTKSGKRVIPLNNEAMSAIREMKKINFNSEYVFASENGTMSSPFTIDKTFRNILKKCNLIPTGVHSLRHTCASILFSRGCEPKRISSLLGHSEVFTTYETYIHFIQEQNIVELKDILSKHN